MAMEKIGSEQSLLLLPSPRILMWLDKDQQLLSSVLSLSSGVYSPEGSWRG